MNFDAFWGNRVGKMDLLRSEIRVRKRGPVSEMRREGKKAMIAAEQRHLRRHTHTHKFCTQAELFSCFDLLLCDALFTSETSWKINTSTPCASPETADNLESWRRSPLISLLVPLLTFSSRNNYFDEQQLFHAMTRFIKKRNESWTCSWLLYCQLFGYVIEFTRSLMALFGVFRYRALLYLW